MTEIPLIAVQRIFNPSTGVPGDHTNFYYFEKKNALHHSSVSLILTQLLY